MASGKVRGGCGDLNHQLGAGKEFEDHPAEPGGHVGIDHDAIEGILAMKPKAVSEVEGNHSEPTPNAIPIRGNPPVKAEPTDRMARVAALAIFTQHVADVAPPKAVQHVSGECV
jgi:hypothetical protein